MYFRPARASNPDASRAGISDTLEAWAMEDLFGVMRYQTHPAKLSRSELPAAEVFAAGTSKPAVPSRVKPAPHSSLARTVSRPASS